MVVVRLIGGLGNQLFQYAAGLALSRRLKTELILDASGFQDYKLHAYGLDCYRLGHRHLDGYSRLLFTNARSREAGQATDPWAFRQFLEPGPGYAKAFRSLRGNIYLDGYWQTEKYFAHLRQELLQRLVPAEMPTHEDAAVLTRMMECESVAVHVRRGDYVSSPDAQKMHGLCSLEYYRDAVKTLRSRVNVGKLFVFSDDPTWVQQNLDLGLPTEFVRHNGPDRNFSDLFLMSSCRHQITANSSFSWWAAWLNSNPAKTVIMPEPWFSDPSFRKMDIYPVGAIRVLDSPRAGQTDGRKTPAGSVGRTL